MLERVEPRLELGTEWESRFQENGTRSAFLVRESLPVPGKVANEVCHGDWNYSWFSGQCGLADEQGRMK